MNKLIEKIKQDLSQSLSAGRYKHTIGVAETAKNLALQLGADPNKAELAGWLHDLAKEYKASKLLEEAQRLQIKLDEVDYLSPALLHARVGALLAKETYSISDEEVLLAIAQHTLGRPNMNLLEKIVFLADIIEPGRPREWSQPILEELETKGLNAAVIKSCQSTINEVTQKNLPLHPLTVQTYNFYLSHI
jgi:nicotinate-nucleotide adenylyltransferase